MNPRNSSTPLRVRAVGVVLPLIFVACSSSSSDAPATDSALADSGTMQDAVVDTAHATDTIGATDATTDGATDASPDATSDATTDSSVEVGPGPVGGTPLSTSAFGITAIALDDENVYWTETGSVVGSVNAIPKAGGSRRVLAGSEASPRQLIVDGTDVFWWNGDVRTVSTSGGTPKTIAPGTRVGSDTLAAMGVDASFVYLSRTPCCAGVVGISRVPRGGGTETPLVPANDFYCNDDIVVVGSTLYCFGSSLVSGTSGIVQLPVTGGTPTFFASTDDGGGVSTLVARDGYLYAVHQSFTRGTDFVAGEIARAMLPTGSMTKVIAAEPIGFGVWGDDVFFTDRGPLSRNELRHVRISTKTNDVVPSTHLESPTLVAVDATGAYVASDDGALAMDIVHFTP